MDHREPESMGIYQARTHFSELVEKVEAGQEITITRNGAPVVKMVPVSRKSTPEERGAAIKRMLERQARLSLGGLKIKDLIDEGRR